MPMEQIDPADMPSITAVATHLAQIGDELEAGHVATDDAGLMSTIQVSFSPSHKCVTSRLLSKLAANHSSGDH